MNFEMISEVTLMTLFICNVPLCENVWVITQLSSTEITNIIMLMKSQGSNKTRRSNADQMYHWTDEAKENICRSVLNSDPVIAERIEYLDKTDQSYYAQLINREGNSSDFLKNHYQYFSFVDDESGEQVGDEELMPIYPVAPRDIVVDGKFYEVFGFPCLVKKNNEFTEVYIADSYLEKTYTILAQIKMLKDEDSDASELTVLGFAEMPPEKQNDLNQEILEQLYIESLEALQVKTFLCWDEDESLINTILGLTEKEKVKLCFLVDVALHSGEENWISRIQFKTVNFEHGPVTLTVLEKILPVLRPKHQVVRGIECIAVDVPENFNFILIPNWFHKNRLFVLKYADDQAPVQMILEVPSSPPQSSPKQQKTSTQLTPKRSDRSKAKEQSKHSSSSTEHTLAAATTMIIQKAVVLISHVENIPFLMNKQNRIHIPI